MPEKKEWVGITTNFAIFQGKILEDPVASGDYHFMTLRSVIRVEDENGQYVDVDQDIPLMAKHSGVIQHIKAGRKVQAWCTYRSWNAGGQLQHAFLVRNFDLGEKPFEDKKQSKVPIPPS